MKKLISSLLACALVFFPLTACGGSGAKSGGGSAEENKKTVVIGAQSDLVTLDPGNMYEAYANMVSSGVYDTLYRVRTGTVGMPDPSAATGVGIDDTKTVYTITLRNDITFSSGNKLTAKDVAWSVNRVLNMKQSNAYADVAIVQSVEATDDFTVVFSLNEPDASFLDKLTSSVYSILDSELLKQHGGSDKGGDTARAWLDTASAGSGPFVVKSWSPKELVLEKNPNYWGGNVNIDTIILKKMESVEAELEAIEKGEIDIALDLGAQAAGKLGGKKNVSVVSGTSVLLAFLAMSRDTRLSPEMSSPKVQEAVRCALDYKGYLALAGENSTVPLNCMPLGFTGALTRDLKTEGRNVEKAKELMAEAGYPAGFAITLVCPDIAMEGIDWNMTALKVKDNMAEIGIAVNIETLEYPQFYEKVRSAALPFYLAYWSPHYYDANSQLVFLPGVGENGTVYGGRTGWAADADNQSLLDLAAKMRGEADAALRTEYSEELQREYARDNPFAFLFQPPGIFAYRSDTLETVVYSDLSKKIELRELKAK